MNRTVYSLIGVVTALAAVTGLASLTDPSGESATGPAAATRLPVERSTLVCPQPTSSEIGETTYTAFTPAGGAGREAAGKGSAALLPAASTLEGGGQQNAEKDKSDEDGKGDKSDEGGGSGKTAEPEPVVPLSEPGRPVTADTDGSGSPALTGSATGRLAPGWTVQQTTLVTAGAGRGLLGASCTEPDTEFWFPGVSTAEARSDYIHLVNPDDTPAVVDLELYGEDGSVRTDSGQGINVPGRATIPVLLSTLSTEPVTDVVLHVVARAGRIGAQVQALDDKLGGDWLTASAVSRGTLVLPGVPADATGVRLIAFAPGDADADLKVRLATPTGSITPAGQENLHVKRGMTVAVDLGDLTRGEAGSLLLGPAEEGGDAPVVAALQVLRGKGGDREMGFVPATGPIRERVSAAGGDAAATDDKKGETAALSLVAPEEGVKVRVTASAGSGGGEPVSKTYTLKGGTTTVVDGLRPEGGKGRYALTVEKLSGGPVHAARTLTRTEDGVPMFTVQTLPDDRSTVAVPGVEQDLSVLVD
ncbi:DUF5719 family protein [Streptomyces sp. TRM 70361]|uniref:DUF5719 family protein n=1 Tax=Streptomyces sp. TRM 70361 TaxID=3116553 RepID=UPI002E7B0872|nr:DUF5719 family protein [Streptomyces sp. TRM 70361]MEE1943372.1 DUF5719 family protein [Streptomyces sp. TRM 70361]